MFTVIKGLAAPGVSWIIYAVIAAAIFTMGFSSGWAINGWRLGNEMQTLKAQHEQAVSKAALEALSASEAYRREEQRLNSKVKESEDALRKTVDDNARIAAGLLADRNRLRKSIANYAAGSDAAADTVAACRRDAATLGDVLGDSLQREEEFAGAAETHGASIRALLAAWPN